MNSIFCREDFAYIFSDSFGVSGLTSGSASLYPVVDKSEFANAHVNHYITYWCSCCLNRGKKEGYVAAPSSLLDSLCLPVQVRCVDEAVPGVHPQRGARVPPAARGRAVRRQLGRGGRHGRLQGARGKAGE